MEALQQHLQTTAGIDQNTALGLLQRPVFFCVCVLLTGGIVEQLPTLPIVASLSVLVLLCSAMCRRLLESLSEEEKRKKRNGAVTINFATKHESSLSEDKLSTVSNVGKFHTPIMYLLAL